MPRQKAKGLSKKDRKLLNRKLLEFARHRICQITREIMDLEEERRSYKALVLILEPFKPR